MNITFTCGEGRTYTTIATRDDGVVLQVPSYDRTFALPHDLGHYVVEHGLGLKRGFWGCIAAGALFPGIKVISGRQSPHAAARSQAIIREAGQQGTESEVLLDVLLKIMNEGLENNWSAVNMLLREVWRPNKPARALPDADEVRRICSALRQAQQQWQTLETGQTMTVRWSLV